MFLLCLFRGDDGLWQCLIACWGLLYLHIIEIIIFGDSTHVRKEVLQFSPDSLRDDSLYFFLTHEVLFEQCACL
jgi:hypothetical protein